MWMLVVEALLRLRGLSFAYMVGFPFKAWGWSHSGYHFLSFTSHLLTCGRIADPYKSRALYSLKVSKSGIANSMGKFPRYHFCAIVASPLSFFARTVVRK